MVYGFKYWNYWKSIVYGHLIDDDDFMFKMLRYLEKPLVCCNFVSEISKV